MSSKENVDEKELRKDVPDTSAVSRSIPYNQIQPTIIPLIKSSTEKYAAHYNMDKHGLAIIFNHENFSFDDLEPRYGTDRDSENMKNTLKSLGFTVEEYKDFTYEQIKLTLQAVAKQDHTDYDCLIVCILSYGNVRILYANDQTYRADSIWSYFTPSKGSTDCNYKDNENDKEKEKEEKTLTLTGKPKLFFIQATLRRLKEVYIANMMPMSTVPDSISSSTNVFRLPNHADFLIAYSTNSIHESFLSYQKLEYESPFIEILCKVLKQFGKEYDLLTLLTSVCRYVQGEHKINIGDVEIIQKYEVPHITSMLTRLLKFKPAEN